MLKPYVKRSKPMPFSGSHPQAKWESTMSLVSAALSVIGVIIAASSSLFTWEQVRLMRAERTTPYKVALYEKKLQSFQSIIGTTYRLAHSTLNLTIALTGENLPKDKRPTREPKRQMLDRYEKDYSAFTSSYDQDSAVWNKDIQHALRLQLFAAYEVRSCFEKAMLPLTKRCDNATLYRHADDYGRTGEVAEQMMQAEILTIDAQKELR